MAMRMERDSLGELELPGDAYYGVQTARAVRNFPISGMRAHPQWIRAVALIKIAAARANRDLGYLDARLADAVIEAGTAVSEGRLNDQMIVDVFQAGAGTSFHMNVNEVIANLGCEILGSVKGNHKLLSPNDHVNMGQSTNDVIPTSMRLAALALSAPLAAEVEQLAQAFGVKAVEFDGVIKAGRTHLQDAVPVRLGQEFGGYASAVLKQGSRLADAGSALEELGIGGSAVGTGVNTHPDYRERVVQYLAELTGLPLRPSSNLFEAMQSMAPFTELSAVLRNLAVELIRIANDLRLLASGPNTGLYEIVLPSVQPGSSIMPGKVNPVLAEMLNMVCFQVVGNDTCVMMAAQAGQLELNVMMPVIAHNLLQSLEILRNALEAFRVKCVAGITANADACRRYAENTLALATVLNPFIGYLNAAEVARESLRTGKSISAIVKEKRLLSDEDFAAVFHPDHLTAPRKIR